MEGVVCIMFGKRDEKFKFIGNRLSAIASFTTLYVLQLVWYTSSQNAPFLYILQSVATVQVLCLPHEYSRPINEHKISLEMLNSLLWQHNHLVEQVNLFMCIDKISKTHSCSSIGHQTLKFS